MKAAFTKEACVGVLMTTSLLGLGVYTELKDSHSHSAKDQNRPFVDGRPIVSKEVTGLPSPKPIQAKHLQIDSLPVATASAEHTAPLNKSNGAELLGRIFLAGYFTYIAANIGCEEFKRRRAIATNAPSP